MKTSTIHTIDEAVAESPVFDLADCISESGFAPRSYSGRGMYSRECIGISTDHNPFAVIADLIETIERRTPEVLSEALRVIRRTQTESLGHGVVIYWPDEDWTEQHTADYSDGDEDYSEPGDEE